MQTSLKPHWDSIRSQFPRPVGSLYLPAYTQSGVCLVMLGHSRALPLIIWKPALSFHKSLTLKCRKDIGFSAFLRIPYSQFLVFLVWFLWDRVSCSPGWCRAQYIVEDDFEFLIFLPLLPKCWDYRHALSHIVFVVCVSNLVVLGRHPSNGYTLHT